MSGSLRWTDEDFQRYMRKFTPKGVMPPAQQHTAVESAEGGVTHPPTNTSRNKYRNTRTLVTFAQLENVSGHMRLCHEFDSKKEAEYYTQLCLLRQSGQIADLVLQKPYPLMVPDLETKELDSVGEWFADFEYAEVQGDGQWMRKTVDIKSPGTRTALYALKKKIIERNHGLTITEI